MQTLLLAISLFSCVSQSTAEDVSITQMALVAHHGRHKGPSRSLAAHHNSSVLAHRHRHHGRSAARNLAHGHSLVLKRRPTLVGFLYRVTWSSGVQTALKKGATAVHGLAGAASKEVGKEVARWTSFPVSDFIDAKESVATAGAKWEALKKSIGEHNGCAMMENGAGFAIALSGAYLAAVSLIIAMCAVGTVVSGAVLAPFCGMMGSQFVTNSVFVGKLILDKGKKAGDAMDASKAFMAACKTSQFVAGAKAATQEQIAEQAGLGSLMAEVDESISKTCKAKCTSITKHAEVSDEASFKKEMEGQCGQCMNGNFDNKDKSHESDEEGGIAETAGKQAVEEAVAWVQTNK